MTSARRGNGAGEGILTIAGGVIPAADAQILKAQGVAEVFGPGSSTQQMVDFIQSRVPSR